MMQTQSTATNLTDQFESTEDFALKLDASDPLSKWREQFICPVNAEGERLIYFAGNSLGLQPKNTSEYVQQEIEDWQKLAVKAHLGGRTPWYSYHENFSEAGARLVGGKPGAREVVMMNSLTVNLHLMLVTFYQPTVKRYKIVMEWPAFPSDLYAVTTHLRTRGLDPDNALVQVKPREGEHTIRQEDIVFASRAG